MHAGELALHVAVVAWFFAFPVREHAAATVPACLEHRRCRHGLRDSWLGPMDLTDIQWREFRGSLPLLAAGLVGFVLLSRAARAWGSGPNHTAPRVAFYLLSSAGFLGYLQGAAAILVVALALGSFAIGRALQGSRWNPALTWLYCAALMVVQQYYRDAVRFAPLGLGWLDRYRGLWGWHVGVNLIVLRLISFNLDLYWAARGSPSWAAWRAKHQARCGLCAGAEADKKPDAFAGCYDWRVHAAQPLRQFSAAHFLAYVFYVPLHLAGPTTTFNAFAAQLRVPQRTHSGRQLAVYAARLALCLLLLELGTRHFYVFAVAHTPAVYQRMAPVEVAALGFVTLNLMWLKFLVIWRFFRLWALCDGVETVENMNRCVNNNYSLSGFWRSWHRAFNQWLLRYVYIPLGGSSGKLWNTFVVFTFVALWHDMTLQLLAWGWMCALFFVPETVVLRLVRRPQFAATRARWWYRVLAGMAAAAYIYVLVVANLIGYSVGVDGVQRYLAALATREGLPVVLGTYGVFYSGAQLMFWVREREERAGKGVGY